MFYISEEELRFKKDTNPDYLNEKPPENVQPTPPRRNPTRGHTARAWNQRNTSRQTVRRFPRNPIPLA